MRLRTGWFSDRSATYLASGRPVITQDTGFGNVLPDRRGAVRLRLARRGRWRRSRRSTPTTRATPRAAREIAREYFSHEVVLRPLLERSRRRARRSRAAAAAATGLPAPRWSLEPVSRRPTALPRATVEAAQRAADPAPRGARRRWAPAAPASSSSPTTTSPSPGSAWRACSPTPRRGRLRADRRRQRLGRRHPGLPARLAERDARVRVLLNGAQRRLRAGLQPGPGLAARRRTWSCSTTTRWCRRAGSRGLLRAPARPGGRAGRAGHQPDRQRGRDRDRLPDLGRVPRVRRAGAPREHAGEWLEMRHAGDVLPGDAPPDLPPASGRSTSASRSACSRTTTTPSGRAQAGYELRCVEDVARPPLRRGLLREARRRRRVPADPRAPTSSATRRSGAAVAALRAPPEPALRARGRAAARGGQRDRARRTRRCWWSAAATRRCCELERPPRPALPAGRRTAAGPATIPPTARRRSATSRRCASDGAELPGRAADLPLVAEPLRGPARAPRSALPSGRLRRARRRDLPARGGRAMSAACLDRDPGPRQRGADPALPRRVLADLPRRLRGDRRRRRLDRRDRRSCCAGYGDRDPASCGWRENGGFARACNDGAAAAARRAARLPQQRHRAAAGLARGARQLRRRRTRRPRWSAPSCSTRPAPSSTPASSSARTATRTTSTPGFPADHPAVNRSRRLQAVTAACMLVRRAAFERVGGFDAGFDNSLEDVDLCLRIGASRGRGPLLPRGGASSTSSRPPAGAATASSAASPSTGERWRESGPPRRPRGLRRGRPDRGRVPGRLPAAALDLPAAGERRRRPRGRGRAAAGVLRRGRSPTCSREVVRLTALAGVAAAAPAPAKPRPMPARPPGVAGRGASARSRGSAAAAGAARPVPAASGLGYRLHWSNRSGPPSPSGCPAGRRCSSSAAATASWSTSATVDAGHFPQDADGRYLGHHPSDSDDALARLEALRERGAEYLVLPATSYWWLDHYDGLPSTCAVAAPRPSSAVCTIYRARPRCAETPFGRGSDERATDAPGEDRVRRAGRPDSGRRGSARAAGRPQCWSSARATRRCSSCPACAAAHFPQDASGGYAGHHPHDSATAIAELEELRRRGAEYLVLPATARWWLDFYGGLADAPGHPRRAGRRRRGRLPHLRARRATPSRASVRRS